MRIRRFEAPDSKTALAMVKAELGDDAVILANRTIPIDDGAARPYGRTKVEVVAAMDYDLYSIAGYKDVGAEKPAVVGPNTVEENSSTAGKGSFSAELEKMAETNLPRDGVGKSALQSRPLEKSTNLMLERHQQPVRPEIKSESTAGCTGGRGRSLLVDQETQPRRKDRVRPPAEDVARWREQLIERIRYNSIFDLRRSAQRIIALVGATGVGKTTTVAKIAAHARLHKGLKVGLVSMDCYRIGATDQLRTYARIMHIPSEIALREKDLSRVVALQADCDLILIDTAGKSPYDEGHISELARWFAGVRPEVEPYLTISATTKKEDLKAVFENYRQMDIAGLILTKLDETRAYAALCQQLAAGEIPVSCLCTGQRVPEDLVLASEETVGLLFRKGWQVFAGKWATNSTASMQNLAV